MLGTLMPFDAPQVIATNAPLPPAGQVASAQFYTQYPVTSFTIMLSFAGVAAPGSDLSYNVQYSLDGINWTNCDTIPRLVGNICQGTVQCPAAMQFQVSAENTNAANVSPTVSASALIPRSVA